MNQQQTESPPNNADRPVAVPPSEKMFVLHRYPLLGSMRDNNGHAEHLVSLQKGYGSFAACLRQLAMTYKSRALLLLIEQYLDSSRK